MNSNKIEEDTSNCPDCQLQLLQQQVQSTPPPANHQHLNQTVFNDHVQQQQHSSQNSSRGHYDHHHQNPFDSSSTSTEDFCYETRLNTNNMYNNKSTSSTSVPSTVTLSSNNTTGGVNTYNELLSNNNPCLTPLPLEACDLKSYCLSCAVLDLPTNDKYYRSSLSRHSVYHPPIFYGQVAPPMPGFSPIPDIRHDIPWGNCNSNSNDFAPYPYNPYPQQTTTSNDYYSTSSSTVLSTNGHSFTTESTSQVTNCGTSCSFSFPNNNPTSSTNNCPTNDNICYKRTETNSNNEQHNKGGYNNSLDTNTTCIDDDDDDSVMPICISSSSDDSSDSGSFLSQNEVIVEDIDEEEVEDDENTNVNASLNLCQEQEKNQKCIICQNLILTECTSPWLGVNIENIHHEITAEDLDLSVSSGDIEIGGIEDEVRDFHPKKQHSPQITISRLAYLLNIPPSTFISIKNTSESTSSSLNLETIVNLCTKCGKLCFIVDSLEKQLRIHTTALKQFLDPHSSPHQINKPSQLPCTSDNDRSMNKNFHPNTICCGDEECPVERLSRTPNISKLVACKVTQTETFEEKLSQVSTIVAFDNHQIESPVLTLTSTVGMDTQEGILEVDENKHKNDFAKKLSNEELKHDQLSPTILQQASQSEMSPSFVPESVINAIIDSKNELEEIDTSPENTTTDCLACDQLENARKYYLCDECGVIVTSRRTFENHFKRHHNELNFKCESCLKGFANEAALKAHRRIHTKEKPFPCSHCSKSFSTKSNANAHFEICRNTNILIEKSNEFLIPTNNMPSKFTDSKLQCGQCGISFRLKARLVSHQSKGCKSKVFECPRCLKKFSKLSELKTHALVHDNVKPFPCPLCELSFTTKGNLVTHQRTHSSERRFTCTICSKAFNRRHALQLHYNRHNGVQPFCCDICNRKFFDPSNLQNHKKIHLKNSHVSS